jgi:hypothetical protein
MTKLRHNTLYTFVTLLFRYFIISLLRYFVTSLLRYFITTIEDVVYPRANGSR